MHIVITMVYLKIAILQKFCFVSLLTLFGFGKYIIVEIVLEICFHAFTFSLFLTSS